MQQVFPRVIIAGLSGDSGKTLVAVGLVRALQEQKLRIAPFKKGPDFIDAAWLGAAAGVPAKNLDTFLMPPQVVLASLAGAATGADMAVVEGNRGLFDGMDAQGTHSTAELAKLTGSPVVLVLDATKTTRTLAALVLGVRAMDAELPLVGVILNRVGTARQEALIRQTLRDKTDLPVLGVIPRVRAQHLPSRHLGLVTAMEHPDAQEALAAVADLVGQHTDLAALIELAKGAEPLDLTAKPPVAEALPPVSTRIGVLQDKAFTFYYPENLAALAAAGAELVSVSPLRDEQFPAVDALYAGGGFPEMHLAELSANRSFRESLARRIEEGLPVWAECGGLMYLSRAIVMAGTAHPMVGALPVVVEQQARPQGHGYVEARVDGDNPFFPLGTTLRGHEFHYSRLQARGETLKTVLALGRGVGIGEGRDGIRQHEVVASYLHLHALGQPEWAPALVQAACGRRSLDRAGGMC